MFWLAETDESAAITEKYRLTIPAEKKFEEQKSSFRGWLPDALLI